MIKTLGYLWALPLTLAGLALAVCTGSEVYPMTPEGVRFCKAGKGLDWFFARNRVIAFTWGGCLVFRRDLADGGFLPPQTVRHELIHFEQAKRWGILLPFAYGVASLVALCKGLHPYHDNYFEVQARELSK